MGPKSGAPRKSFKEAVKQTADDFRLSGSPNKIRDRITDNDHEMTTSTSDNSIRKEEANACYDNLPSTPSDRPDDVLGEKKSTEPVSPDPMQDLSDRLFNESNWQQLLRDQIVAIYVKIFGFKSTKRKLVMITEIMSKLEHLLSVRSKEEIAARYIELQLHALPTREFLLRVPSLFDIYGCSAKDFHAECQDLMAKLNQLEIANKRVEIMQHRSGIDLYSQLPLEQLVDPHVDHIVERQLVANCILSSGLPKAHAMESAFFQPIRTIVNKNINLNVTEAILNVTKGNAFTQFLKEEAATGTPTDLHVILMHTTKGRERAIGKYVNSVMLALNDAFPAVEEEIAALRRSDGHVTGNHYQSVADRLHDLYCKARMREYLDIGPQTRSRALARTSYATT